MKIVSLVPAREGSASVYLEDSVLTMTAEVAFFALTIEGQLHAVFQVGNHWCYMPIELKTPTEVGVDVCRFGV